MTEQRAPGELVSKAATVDARKAIKIEERISIDRPAAELYAIWHTFERLPDYIEELESVTTLTTELSHWVVKLPAGKHIEWDAQLVNDLPNELIAWKTVANPDVAHAGSVHFRDVSPGKADMRIVIDYEPPGGKLGLLLDRFTRVFGQSLEFKIRADLLRFKKQVEAR
jgi:uncharacterized membrane protein